MKTSIQKTKLNGLYVVSIDYFQDARGFFIEPWNKKDFAKVGLSPTFVQEGHSRSGKNVLRGLHYQNATAPMGKLVRCTVGSIFDVALDIRSSSLTFGQYFSILLSAENKLQVYVPSGFAHGFLTLSDVAEVQYKQTGFYTPKAEGTIRWNDPTLHIQWPTTSEPFLSERDQKGISWDMYLRSPAF